ncbi:arginine decarboxylase, partial [Clostridium perfringens]
RNLALHGREMVQQSLEMAHYLRREFNKIPGLDSVGEEILGSEAAYDLDPTKVTIHVRHLGITGYETENWLREQYNVEVELSDMYNILCIITPGDTQESIETLLTALRSLSECYYKENNANELIVKIPEIPQLSLIP